jgi:hypothetical protein
MSAKGRIEIRVKFDGIPMATHNSRGSSQIEVFCEGYTVLAEVKTKTLNRFLDATRELYPWEGLLSGELRHIQGHQLMLINAGLQCVEKKTKVPKLPQPPQTPRPPRF